MSNLLLGTWVWDRDVVGDGAGYSCRLSIRLLFEPRDLWIGAYWNAEYDSRYLYICLLPCLPIRIHYRRAYGGRFTKS